MNNPSQRPQSSGPWSANTPPAPAPSPQFELDPTPAPQHPGQFQAPAHPQQGELDPRFRHQRYLLQKQFWKMLGAAFRIYDPQGQLAFYSKQKAFKIKEDIRVFTDEAMTHEILTIKARSIMDFSAAYDVTDSRTGQKIGTLRRKGFRSIIQDEWQILDAYDREMGTIKEDSTVLAVIRRFIDYASLFIPQKFHGTIGHAPVLHFQQNFNPFLAKIDLDFSSDVNGLLDRRLGIAAAILLCAIEGKQS